MKVDGQDSTELQNKTITIGLFKGNDPAADAAPMKTATLTVNGASTTATLFDNLEMGSYYVYELDADNHPVKSGGTVTLSGTAYTVTEQNPNVTLATAGQVGSVIVTNSRTTEVTHDQITVTKVDPENKPVAGATFTLYKADKTTAVKSFTTTGAENGNVFTIATNDAELAGCLPEADGGTTTLYLKETGVPANYKGDANEYPVVITRTVTVSGSVTTTAYTITIDGSEAKAITNTPLGELKITKNITVNGQSSSRTGTFWYAVYAAADVENGAPKKGADDKINVDPAKDADGNSLVGSITVNKDGAETKTIGNLYYGDYYVFELTGDPGNGAIDVKLIVSNTDGVDAAIGGTVYHVTESGTTRATVGETAGVATLNNDVSMTSITGVKTWKPFTSDQGDHKNPVNTALTLTLTRYIVEGNNYIKDNNFDEHKVIITADASGNITRTDQPGTTISAPQTEAEYKAAWSKTWNDLPLFGNSTSVRYVYRVEESVDNEWYYHQPDEQIEYLPKTGSNGETITTQQLTNIERSPVSLPATGGMGTGVVYGAGAALMLLAVLGLILLNRKRTDGEGIR